MLPGVFSSLDRPHDLADGPRLATEPPQARGVRKSRGLSPEVQLVLDLTAEDARTNVFAGERKVRPTSS